MREDRVLVPRRQIARLAGSKPNSMIGPIKVYGRIPGVLRGVAKFEQESAKLHSVDKRFSALAELKAATLRHCDYCIDLG